MNSLKKIQRPLVFVPMAADIFHHGHINILLKAKKYGNVVVGLMTDAGIKSYKKKKPIIAYKNRIKIIEQLKCVKIVLPLNGLKYLEYAEYYKFEYFVHGDDWKKNVQSQHRKKLILLMKKWGGKVLEFPYTKNISSSKIKQILSK
jgi:phosphoenolpyruvate phosphomutase / 2-hydroxyethylphosphonate cytidylyltransferase